jgi:hypothetical protein
MHAREESSNTQRDTHTIMHTCTHNKRTDTYVRTHTHTHVQSLYSGTSEMEEDANSPPSPADEHISDLRVRGPFLLVHPLYIRQACMVSRLGMFCTVIRIGEDAETKMMLPALHALFFARYLHAHITDLRTCH